MTLRYSCPSCRAPVEVADDRQETTAHCPRCGKQHVVPASAARGSPGGSPRRRAKATFQPAESHLVAERHDVPTRGRLLAKLADLLDRKVQDPELLYLGARYAVSLGLGELACRFLDPLSELLHDDGRPSPAFFPVGVLYLRALAPGDLRRGAVLGKLRELAAGAPRLASLLACVGGDPQGQAPAGSPQRWLELVEQHFSESLWLEFAAPDDGDGNGDAVRTLRRLHREAARDYKAGRLAPARRAMESALLLDGDQPGVLRNLVTVASEQRDAEAYGRYWRRFVKLLLWRIMRGDDPWSAYHELTQFYKDVATATDREFSEPGVKIVERLRIPGLLPRWLEAHAALVWLDSVRRPNRTEQASLSIDELRRARLGNLEVMRFWYRVFYPEFARFLDVGEYVAPPEGQSQGVGSFGRYPFNRRRTRLPFAPVERLLKRFAEWSKVQFGLNADHGPHAEVVTALAGFVARIPIRPHAQMLSSLLAADELNPLPLRRTLQQACSLPLRMALGRFLGRADEDEKERKEDWEGLIAYYGDAHLQDFLTPDLRMFLAFAHCRCRQPDRALEIARHTLPDMQPDDLREDAQVAALWKNVVRANFQAIPDDDLERRQAAIAALKERIEAIPVEGPHDEFRKACVREFLVHEQVERAIRESQELAKQGQWADARKVIERMPDDSAELGELKQNLLRQIDEAEQQSKLHERIEKAIEESKALVGKGKFAEARNVIRRLPDQPEDLKNLKKSLLSQIDEAEKHARLQERVEKAIEKSKALVEKGKFAEAKDVVRRLPDEPEDLKNLKRNLWSQIDEAEQHAMLQQRVEKAVRESKSLVEKARFVEAKDVVRRLPDEPEDLKSLKQNLLRQIDEAEQQSKLHERIEKTIEESKALVGKGKFAEARNVIRRLPDQPDDLKNLKKSLLSQIDEAEQQSKLHERIEKAIEESKALVEKGKFREAKDVIRRLPDQPEDLRSLKRNFVSQIEEMEGKVGGVNTENMEILARLQSRNINLAAVAQMASDNNLDMSNPFALNALLKAIEKQIRGW